MQDGRPITYFSQNLSDRAHLRSVYERELMVIVLAVQKWCHYVIGHRFVVRTDQRSLKFLLEQRVICEEYQRWVTKLLGFDFDIQYKPGLENKAVDALSRCTSNPSLSSLTVPTLLDITAIAHQVDADPYLSKVKQQLLKDPNSYPHFTWEQGRLLYKGWLVIPSGSTLIPLLLREFHSIPAGGHSGFLRTYKRLVANLYWKGLKKGC